MNISLKLYERSLKLFECCFIIMFVVNNLEFRIHFNNKVCRFAQSSINIFDNKVCG